MPKYLIKASEIWTSEYLIEASSEAEAIANFKKGNGDMVENEHEYVELNQGESGIDCCLSRTEYKLLSDYYDTDTRGIVSITLDWPIYTKVTKQPD